MSKQRPAQNPTAAVAGQGSARTLPASLAARAWAATTKQQQGARGPRQEGEWQQARGRALRVRNAPAEPLPLSNIFAALLSRVAGAEEEQQPAAIGLQQQQPMRKQHQQPMMQQSQQQQQQSPAVDDADMQYINKLLNWLAASPSKQVPAPKAPTSWVAGAPSAVASEQQQQQQRQQQHTRESGRAQEQQPSQQRRNRPRRTCQPTRWLVVGSLNVAGMSEVALADVKRIVVNQGIDVLAVQESWEGSGQCKVGQIKGYRWFGRPREGGMHGGVGYFVHCSLLHVVQPHTKVEQPDAMWLKVKGNGRMRALCIGNIYMPTDNSPAAQKREAFEKLKLDMASFRRKGELLLIGDFNARVGSAQGPHEHIGMHGEAITPNSNGKLLKQLLQDEGLFALNGREPAGGGSPVAYTRERVVNGIPTLQSVVDYAVVESDTYWGPSRPTFKVHTELEVSTSDHKLLTVGLHRMANRSHASSKHQYRRVFKVERLQGPSKEEAAEVMQAYTTALAVEVPAYQAYVQETYEKAQANGSTHQAHMLVRVRLHAVVERVAEATLGSKLVRAGSPCGKAWWTAEVKQAIAARRQAHAVWRAQGANDAGLWASYLEHRDQVHRLVKEAKSEWVKEGDAAICTAFEAARDSGNGLAAKEVWNKFDSMYRPKHEQGGFASMLQRGDGSYVCDDKGIAVEFGRHYSSLGNSAAFSEGAGFNDGFQRQVESEVVGYWEGSQTEDGVGDATLDCPLSQSDVSLARLQLKVGKAGSPFEDMPVGLLKYGGSSMDELLLCMYSKAWEHESCYQRPGAIISLFKKGDKADPGNYRGITLLSVVDKLYTKIIHNRLASFAEEHGLLHESQCGFRKGRPGCIEHTWSLHTVIHSRLKASPKLPTYALFVDVVKAFPSVWRDGLYHKLWNMGVKGKMWRVLYRLFDAESRCAMQGGECSEQFGSGIGLPEGDPLSPLLYTLFVNGLLVEVWAKHEGVPLGGTGAQNPVLGKLVALMLADDFVGLAESKEKLQKLADTVHAYSLKWRFKLSASKSAVVVFDGSKQKNGCNKPSGITFGQSAELQLLDEYKYLGLVLAKSGTWESHMQYMVEGAVKSIDTLSAFFKSRNVRAEVKRAMLLCLIRPKAEYGSEVWWLNKAQAISVESKVQMYAVTKMLHVSPKACHDVLRAELGIRPLQSWWDERKMEWWHKLEAMPEHRLCKLVYKACCSGGEDGMGKQAEWQKKVDGLLASINIEKEGVECCASQFSRFKRQVKEGILSRDKGRVETAASGKSTLKRYLERYSFGIQYSRPQPFLHGESLRKGRELLLQMRAGCLPVRAFTCKFGRQEGAKECPSCHLEQGVGGEVESLMHFMLSCDAYAELRQVMWQSLRSEVCLSSAVSKLDSMSSDEDRLHAMLSEGFWGVEIDLNGRPCGPYEAAFQIMQQYVHSAWKLRNACAHPVGEDGVD